MMASLPRWMSTNCHFSISETCSEQLSPPRMVGANPFLHPAICRRASVLPTKSLLITGRRCSWTKFESWRDKGLSIYTRDGWMQCICGYQKYSWEPLDNHETEVFMLYGRYSPYWYIICIFFWHPKTACTHLVCDSHLLWDRSGAPIFSPTPE